MSNYLSIDALIAAEQGNQGHVLREPDSEIGGEHFPESFSLENVSSPVGGARRDVFGWFDGTSVQPINHA